MTTARMLASALIFVSASASSPLSARLSALSTRGRLSVMATTLSVRSHTIFAYMRDLLQLPTSVGSCWDLQRSGYKIRRRELVTAAVLDRPRMQHVDRVADVQALAQPAGHRRPRVQCESVRLVLRADLCRRICRERGRRRHLGNDPPVRAFELELAVR